VTNVEPPSELDRESLDRIVRLDLRVREAIDEFARHDPDLTVVVATLNRAIADVIAAMGCPQCRANTLAFTRKCALKSTKTERLLSLRATMWMSAPLALPLTNGTA
jgi:hypothetical protein